MLDRYCAQCENPLAATVHHNQRYCSAECKRLASRERERPRDRESAARKRAARSPEQHAADLAYLRAWRAANRDRVKALNRAAYLANPQAYAEQRDRWRLEHPEQHLDIMRNVVATRRARKLGNGLRRVTRADIARMFTRAGGICSYCGTAAKLTVDHVIPLARGGAHSIGNLVAACETCNKRKGKLLLAEWRLRLALEAVDPRGVPVSGGHRPRLDRRVPSGT